MVWTSQPGPNQGRAAEGDNSRLRVTDAGRRRFAFPSRRAALVEHYVAAISPEPAAVACRGARSPPCNADPDYLPSPEESNLRVSRGGGGACVTFNQNYSPELGVAASLERAALNRSPRLASNWPDLFPGDPAAEDGYAEVPRLLNYSNYTMRFGPSLPERFQRLSSPFAEHKQPALHRTSPGWVVVRRSEADGSPIEGGAAAVGKGPKPAQSTAPTAAEPDPPPRLADAVCQTTTDAWTQTARGSESGSQSDPEPPPKQGGTKPAARPRSSGPNERAAAKPSGRRPSPPRDRQRAAAQSYAEPQRSGGMRDAAVGRPGHEAERRRAPPRRGPRGPRRGRGPSPAPPAQRVVLVRPAAARRAQGRETSSRAGAEVPQRQRRGPEGLRQGAVAERESQRAEERRARRQKDPGVSRALRMHASASRAAQLYEDFVSGKWPKVGEELGGGADGAGSPLEGWEEGEDASGARGSIGSLTELEQLIERQHLDLVGRGLLPDEDEPLEAKAEAASDGSFSEAPTVEDLILEASDPTTGKSGETSQEHDRRGDGSPAERSAESMSSVFDWWRSAPSLRPWASAEAHEERQGDQAGPSYAESEGNGGREPMSETAEADHSRPQQAAALKGAEGPAGEGSQPNLPRAESAVPPTAVHESLLSSEERRPTVSEDAHPLEGLRVDAEPTDDSPWWALPEPVAADEPHATQIRQALDANADIDADAALTLLLDLQSSAPEALALGADTGGDSQQPRSDAADNPGEGREIVDGDAESASAAEQRPEGSDVLFQAAGAEEPEQRAAEAGGLPGGRRDGAKSLGEASVPARQNEKAAASLEGAHKNAAAGEAEGIEDDLQQTPSSVAPPSSVGSRQSSSFLPSLSELRGSIELELERARRVLESTAHLSRQGPVSWGSGSFAVPEGLSLEVSSFGSEDRTADSQLRHRWLSGGEGPSWDENGSLDGPSDNAGSAAGEQWGPEPKPARSTTLDASSSSGESLPRFRFRRTAAEPSADVALPGFEAGSLRSGPRVSPGTAAPWGAEQRRALAPTSGQTDGANGSDEWQVWALGYADIDDIPTPEGSSIIATEVSDTDDDLAGE